jgi:hypothetical protein
MQTTIDLGPTIVTLEAERGHSRNLVIITAFVNGTSLRSSNLHLPAIRDRFLDGLWLMSGAEELDVITRQMRTWINSAAEVAP